MTRVDFYILSDVDQQARWRFACRLAYKALTSGQHIHVHTSDEEHQQSVDQMMWTYPEHLFLPHACAGDESTASSLPLVIGYEQPQEHFDQVLINLDGSIPGFFGRFERVVEIIVDSVKAEGRDKYKYYRDRGYPLFHHSMDNWND